MDVAIMFDGEMGRENREGISLVCSSVVFFPSLAIIFI